MTAEIQTARVAVRKMLECVGIKRVISVDDAYARDEATFMTIIGAANAEQRAQILEENENSRMADDGVASQLALHAWADADEHGKGALLDRARKIDPADETEALLQVLRELLPGVDTEGLSLSEWQRRQDDVIAELDAKPTLIFFDQSFTTEKAGTESAGQRLIKDLQGKVATPASPVYYGLLTNLVNPADEHERRQIIVSDEKLDSARFVLIAKSRLSGSKLEFAGRLRTVLLAPIFAGLTEAVSKGLDEVREQAREEFAAIEPEEMEQMVLHSSAKEGVWEPDTLLRILEVMQRSPAREVVRGDSEVERLVAILRCLTAIQLASDQTNVGSETAEPAFVAAEPAYAEPAKGEQGPDDSKGWRIRRKEIYEERDHINALHLPIELGDIFRHTTTNSEFVVIAQPCDTMVRPDGKRAPEVTHFLLAAVSRDGDGDGHVSAFALRYFDEFQGSHAHVKLNRPKVVRARVLDFCVFNPDGRSRFDLAAGPADGLLPTWKKRHALYFTEATSVLDDIAKVKANTPEALRRTIAGDIKQTPFQTSAMERADGILEFTCERIGRLCDPYARALLSRFSQYFARDAEPHDFTGA